MSFHVDGQEYRVDYLPAESDSGMFGGNSNWRGPIWMPVNVLIIRALLQFYSLLRGQLQGRMSDRVRPDDEPVRSRRGDLASGLHEIFLRDAKGRRPVYGGTTKFQNDPHWRDHLLFYEYFHGDNGAGLGASHQTGWTGTDRALIMHCSRTDGSPSRLSGRQRHEGDGFGTALSHQSRDGEPTQNVKSMSASRYPLALSDQHPRLADGVVRTLGRPATLDDIPDAELDRLAKMGFDWIWFLSVWQTGPAGQHVSRTNPEWRREFQETLPDLREDDIAGSGFAITGYTVHQDLGGDAALARLRERLRKRGLKLMLDFVPNHTGLDHPWVEDHPEYYIAGTELDLARAPQNYTWVKRKQRRPAARLRTRSVLPRLARHAAAQLRQSRHAGSDDRRAAEDRRAMRRRALRHGHAGPAGCFRTDLGPPARSRSGRRRPQRVREQAPDFCFMAEVYWDLEWTLQQQGFDYTYDKRLYDRLREGHARPVRDHLRAELDYQNKLARFLENHDEPRAAATFPPGMHEAAAVITFLSPGLRFFHQGQFEGRKKRISPHLVRGPIEPVDEPLHQFYDSPSGGAPAAGRS